VNAQRGKQPLAIPESDVSRSYDPRVHAYDDQTRHAGMLYVLMIVIAVAFGGFLWQLYSAPEIPRIPAPSGPYKVEPPPEPPARELTALERSITGGTSAPLAPVTPAEETPVVELNPQPDVPAMPHTVVSGPYVAQLAALQSEAATEGAWRRLASRAPDLFAGVRMDVERADLGARGVYYRVRAGYFADREEATLFCERIRQMRQDCIVAAR
jgi:SPOR domain